jgi:hypothetical protein
MPKREFLRGKVEVPAPIFFDNDENDRTLLKASNFWDSELAKEGALFVSINAKTFRVLVPDSLEKFIADMATAKMVVVSRGPWPEEGLDDAFEMLFDDESNQPMALHLTSKQFATLPAKSDAGRTDLFCSAWTKGPVLRVGPLKCAYRHSPMIPDLSSWKFKAR